LRPADGSDSTQDAISTGIDIQSTVEREPPEMRSAADFSPTDNGICFADPKNSVTRTPRLLVTPPRSYL
jgi:hypothetical protein